MKLNKALGRDNKTIVNFQNEVELLKRLKHPKIVSYLGYKIEGDTIEIYMEHMTGDNSFQKSSLFPLNSLLL